VVERGTRVAYGVHVGASNGVLLDRCTGSAWSSAALASNGGHVATSSGAPFVERGVVEYIVHVERGGAPWSSPPSRQVRRSRRHEQWLARSSAALECSGHVATSGHVFLVGRRG
jgi:hypothetical protein